MDNVISLLGLALRAGRLAVGEDPVATVAHAHDARLILLASDAAENTVRRARHFADAGACLCAALPVTKAELGAGLGRASCAVLAITDIGFADAIAKRLAARDEAAYGALSQRLSLKAARAAERKDPKRRQWREKRGDFRGSGALVATNGSKERNAATVADPKRRQRREKRGDFRGSGALVATNGSKERNAATVVDPKRRHKPQHNVPRDAQRRTDATRHKRRK